MVRNFHHMLSYAGSRRMISVILVFSLKNIRARANNREKCSLLPTVFITWLAEPRHQIQYTEACSKSRKCTLALMASANRLASIFFSHGQPLLARGKILYFGTIKDTNRDSTRHSQNEDNFPTFSLGLEFLKERKTTEKETRHQSRHDSLHCQRVKCNKFWQKDTLVKPNKRQTGLFQPLKVSVNFSVLKLLSLKLEL